MRESHERCEPMIHMDARHKLSQEFQALYDELEAMQAGAAKKRKRG